MPIAALARLSPKPGAERELLERALDVAEDVRGEPGNVLTIVLRDPAHPDDVLMFEVFRDEAAIIAHREARHSVEKGPKVHALLARPMELQRFTTVEAG